MLRGFLFTNFHIPDIASLPAGLFSTLAKLSWHHACIYLLPADLFSIPVGLQALPTALINNFVFHRYIAEQGDAENHDFSYIYIYIYLYIYIYIYIYILDLIRIFLELSSI
jgi:hypothetical protein